MLLWFESRELAPASACNGRTAQQNTSRLDEKRKAAEQVMPDYRIYSMTQDNHIACTPVTIVCDGHLEQ